MPGVFSVCGGRARVGLHTGRVDMMYEFLAVCERVWTEGELKLFFEVLHESIFLRRPGVRVGSNVRSEKELMK